MGLSREPLLLYWSDVDLLKVRRAGRRLRAVLAARVVDSVRGSVQLRIVRRHHRNAVLVATRHLHGRGATRALLSFATSALRRCATSQLKGDGPLPIVETCGTVGVVATTVSLGWLAL